MYIKHEETTKPGGNQPAGYGTLTTAKASDNPFRHHQ